MRWKSNKTKPFIIDNNDTIVVVDVLGNIYFNIKIIETGKSTKIGNKKWDDIKHFVAFWQYSYVVEEYLRKKIKNTFETNNNTQIFQDI